MGRYTNVVDSGKRQEFQTGAVRDTQEGKGRYDLLPPYAMQRLAQHFENGARKYADRNWEKGIPTSRFIDSALRHLFKYLGGGREEDHLAAAAWNILCMIQTEQWCKEGVLPKEVDNLEGVQSERQGKRVNTKAFEDLRKTPPLPGMYEGGWNAGAPCQRTVPPPILPY